MSRRVAGMAAVAMLLLSACTDESVPNNTETSPTPSPSPSASATADGSASPVAIELPTAAPADLGFDAGVLNRLADEAGQLGSNCFLVARDGQVVLEKYWNGASAETAQEVFSVTKSVTSTLVGLAEADGDLTIDDPAATYIEAWRGTPSESVTVRNLLANDSGRFWSNESDYGALLEATDRTAYAVGLEQPEAPGTVWAYNNAAIQTLDAVLRSATGTDPASFAAARLFGPLGMSHSRMTPDGSGHSTNVFFGMHSTCTDLARFGTLFAQDGEWNGEQLLPRAWVRQATGGPSQELNAAYGLLWWLNRTGRIRPGAEEESRFAPGAPEELFAALGLGGQVVLVDPRTDTVVVRLGGLEEGPEGYQFADAARVVTEALTSAG